ncbi:antitoxin [Amycolatopsis roodepoortensis]|uniref:ABC-type transporter Mla subunit MlaD n=1 Tax=Amycolatopsis roodepoortensis TaxID=700274 RepID=A0ABR9LKJ7_9PSEU|nr:antitoxin [Amycolatopsis roodepoortensis]MBE1581189.1 ABC-type transporter Mla subunit MlaD [Amycolatopsis roodepoortensis]
MGINFDELKNKATDALREHNDKIEGGLDKAADFAKSKFSGHDSQIDSGVEKAKGFINKFDDTPDTPPQNQQPQNPPPGQ